MTFSIILATEHSGGIGFEGKIPWNILEDMRLFRYITSYVPRSGLANCVIMGRKTFESLGSRPLKNRVNIVLSRTPPASSGADSTSPLWCTSLDKALALAHTLPIHATYVIGGEQLYKEALDREDWDLLYHTNIREVHICDRFVKMDPYLIKYHTISLSKMTPTVCMGVYARAKGVALDQYPEISGNSGETRYLAQVAQLAHKADSDGAREDRTQVGTYSTFGPQLKFDLGAGFPLLVSKRVPFKMVLKELLFFLSGSTDATKLAAQNVHIWDDNTTRAFLDNRDLKYPNGDPYVEGDMGPMYGFQWRHAGAEYRGCKADYSGQGVDQIAQIVSLLKENPTSRRIILSAHNVADLGQMALHPCHSMFQLYVEDGKLSGKLTQRSADIFLGVPFNIASYALLVHMLARIAGLKVGTLIMSFGDVHLYKSHMEAVTKMMPHSLHPYATIPYPQLVLSGEQTTMDDFALEDFQLLNYVPGPTIRAPMAI